jgi:hypothetical protein
MAQNKEIAHFCVSCCYGDDGGGSNRLIQGHLTFALRMGFLLELN